MNTERLKKAKQGFITRNVDISKAVSLKGKVPEVGDIFLARVDRIRQHTRLENPAGRRMYLYPGDELVVVVGHRYASDQYHARAPATMGACHLVTASGLASNVISKSSKVKPATGISLLGALCDSRGVVLNLSQFAKMASHPVAQDAARLPTITVLGSDMNSGKTTTMSACVNGLSRSGLKVFAAKLTGTGAGPDFWRLKDAGATEVVDFVDAGMPSTVDVASADLVQLLAKFRSWALLQGADVLLVEVADGVLQQETQSLINSIDFRSNTTGVLLASENAVGAVKIIEMIVAAGYPIYGVSGLLTQSEISSAEVVAATGMQVLTPAELMSEDIAASIYSNACRDIQPRNAIFSYQSIS